MVFLPYQSILLICDSIFTLQILFNFWKWGISYIFKDGLMMLFMNQFSFKFLQIDISDVVVNHFTFLIIWVSLDWLFLSLHLHFICHFRFIEILYNTLMFFTSEIGGENLVKSINLLHAKSKNLFQLVSP